MQDDGRQALYSRTPVLFSLSDVEFADSGAGDGSFTIRGHAAVFNRKSHDLGGFRTVIASGAFTKVLDGTPDVHLVWDHDTRYTLARTKNKTLELREDPQGLHVWARVAPTTYAKDLRLLMERGDVDQMSFACDIGTDEWTDTGEEITRTIFDVSGLYDVTVCAQGAFPQTDASLVASLAGASTGAAPDRVDVKQEAAAGPAQAQDGEAVAPAGVGRRQLAALKAQARVALKTTSKE